MDTIKFANGAVYNCAFLSTGPISGIMQAHITLSDVTFVEAAEIFSNTDMIYEMEWGQYRLVGYTTLLGISIVNDGVMAVLRGGHDELI